MKGLLYGTLVWLGRNVGIWIVSLIAWLISSGYFVFFPGRVAESVRFYRALFPHRRTIDLLWLTWRQFHHFATGYSDRLRMERDGTLTPTAEGFDAFREQVAAGRGGILVMSHFGNWEVASRLLRREGIRLMLFMGEKQREQIERRQKEDMARDGILVVSAPQDEGSPLEFLEAVRFLREGGFVSLAGDRVQSARQRLTEGTFCGRRVRVPVAPHLLALVSGAPLFVFFTVRVRAGHYRVILSEPAPVKATSRAERTSALEGSVANYLGLLERAVREHPEHWYHFEPFLPASGEQSMR